MLMKKYGRILVPFILIAILLGAATAQKPALRLLRLEGEAFQRGLIHGKALEKEIRILVDRWKQSLKKTYQMQSEEFIKRFLSATDFKPAIKRWTPGLLDEVRGIAKGAGIDFDTMYAYQLIDEIWAQGTSALSRAPTSKIDKCTSIGVDRRGKQPTIVAQNLDIPRWYHLRQTVLHISEPDSDLESFVLTIPGLVAANGMNSKRVAVAVNTLLQLRPAKDGLPVAFVVRGILARRDHAAALKFLREVKHASGQNYIVGGPDLAPSFECSASKKSRFVPFEGATHSYHTNHPLANDDGRRGRLSLAKDGYRCHRFAVLDDRLGEAAHDKVDVDMVKALLRSRSPEGTSICHASTYACTVMLLGERPELQISCGRPDQNAFEVFRFGQ